MPPLLSSLFGQERSASTRILAIVYVLRHYFCLLFTVASAEDSNDSSNNVIVQGEGDKSPEEAPMPAEDTETSCNEGSYEAVPGDCSSYTRCVGGVRYEQSCASGLHWVTR